MSQTGSSASTCAALDQLLDKATDIKQLKKDLEAITSDFLRQTTKKLFFQKVKSLTNIEGDKLNFKQKIIEFCGKYAPNQLAICEQQGIANPESSLMEIFELMLEQLETKTKTKKSSSKEQAVELQTNQADSGLQLDTKSLDQRNLYILRIALRLELLNLFDQKLISNVKRTANELNNSESLEKGEKRIQKQRKKVLSKLQQNLQTLRLDFTLNELDFADSDKEGSQSDQPKLEDQAKKKSDENSNDFVSIEEVTELLIVGCYNQRMPQTVLDLLSSEDLLTEKNRNQLDQFLAKRKHARKSATPAKYVKKINDNTNAGPVSPFKSQKIVNKESAFCQTDDSYDWPSLKTRTERKNQQNFGALDNLQTQNSAINQGSTNINSQISNRNKKLLLQNNQERNSTQQMMLSSSLEDALLNSRSFNASMNNIPASLDSNPHMAQTSQTELFLLNSGSNHASMRESLNQKNQLLPRNQLALADNGETLTNPPSVTAQAEPKLVKKSSVPDFKLIRQSSTNVASRRILGGSLGNFQVKRSKANETGQSIAVGFGNLKNNTNSNSINNIVSNQTTAGKAPNTTGGSQVQSIFQKRSQKHQTLLRQQSQNSQGKASNSTYEKINGEDNFQEQDLVNDRKTDGCGVKNSDFDLLGLRN